MLKTQLIWSSKPCFSSWKFPQLPARFLFFRPLTQAQSSIFVTDIPSKNGEYRSIILGSCIKYIITIQSVTAAYLTAISNKGRFDANNLTEATQFMYWSSWEGFCIHTNYMNTLVCCYLFIPWQGSWCSVSFDHLANQQIIFFFFWKKHLPEAHGFCFSNLNQ